MNFKRCNGKIFGVILTTKERAALEAEVRHTTSEKMREYEQDEDSAILWMLHVHFGFGPKRLRKAWELFYAEMHKLHEHYEMSPEAGPWLCRKMLKDKLGIDIEAWYKEEEEAKK